MEEFQKYFFQTTFHHHFQARNAKISPIFHFDRGNNGRICHILCVKTVQQSRQHELRAYSPNIYTVQLGKFSYVQMISLILHSIYIVHSGSSFFFTQRRVSVHSFHSMRERFWVFCILACIFVPKIMSFGLLFSYARTFLTVAFIVLFGIGTMALFYDQLGTIHVFIEKF